MHPLDGTRVKVERAKKHVQDLDVVLKAFFDSNPYKVGTKSNPETRQLIYYLTEVRELPSQIPAIVGKGLTENFDERVYSPIFDSATEYEVGKSRKIKGMRPEAIKAIDAVKPYKGGNDQLWRLNRLDVVDKHRLLISIGSRFQSFDVGAHMHEMMTATFSDIEAIPISIFLRPADPMYPLKAGDELFIDAPDAKVNEKMGFRFNVSLSEPQAVAVQPLIETLNQLIDATSKVIESFDSHIFWTP